MKVTWFPPLGDDLLRLDGSPYRLREMRGLGHTAANLVTSRGPGQRGASAIDVAVRERVITAILSSHDRDKELVWEARHRLSRAFASIPSEDGRAPQRGLLRIEREPALPTIEIEAYPRSSPQEDGTSTEHVIFDIELVCPDPYFREITDRTAALQGEGGFEFPLEHPFEMPSFNIELEINNTGDVPVPILARLFGECDTPSLTLLANGTEKVIAIEGQVAEDEFIEINTAYGRKSVTLVHIDEQSRANAMDRLDLDRAEFWELPPGFSTVRFAAATNVSGKATLAWRQQLAGI